MVSAKHRANPMELAWDEAARGYDAYFGPRFAPYLGVGVGALLALEAALPTEGAILVPCVGRFAPSEAPYAPTIARGRPFQVSCGCCSPTTRG